MQYRNKRVSPNTCGDTGVVLNGIPVCTKNVFRSLPKRRRTVTRKYGGYLSAEACRHRILRAFFNEELRVIKQGASQKKTKKVGKRRN